MSDRNGRLLSLRSLCSTIEKHNHSHSRFLGRQPEQQLRRRRDIDMLNFFPFIFVLLRLLFEMESTLVDIEHTIFKNSKTDIGYKTTMLKKVP